MKKTVFATLLLVAAFAKAQSQTVECSLNEVNGKRKVDVASNEPVVVRAGYFVSGHQWISKEGLQPKYEWTPELGALNAAVFTIDAAKQDASDQTYTFIFKRPWEDKIDATCKVIVHKMSEKEVEKAAKKKERLALAREHCEQMSLSPNLDRCAVVLAGYMKRHGHFRENYSLLREMDLVNARVTHMDEVSWVVGDLYHAGYGTRYENFLLLEKKMAKGSPIMIPKLIDEVYYRDGGN